MLSTTTHFPKLCERKDKKRSEKIGEQVLEFSTLQTILFEAAELVNSRPIRCHPTDPDEGVYLSPNDLLLGRSTSRAPRGPFLESSGSKRRYECIQRIIDGFWKKWNRDFFPSTLVKQKWHVEKQNLQVGNIVAIQNKEAKKRTMEVRKGDGCSS